MSSNESDTTNVVDLFKHPHQPSPKSPDGVEKQIEDAKRDFANLVVTNVMDQTLFNLGALGVMGSSTEMSDKYLYMLEQILEGLVHQHFEIDHQFHTLVDHTINIEEGPIDDTD